MWYQACRLWLHITFSFLFKLRVFGRENVPLRGPIVLVSNHQSFLDPILIGAGLSRPLHYLARSTLFERSRIFGAIIRSLNAIPIKRGEFSKDSVRQCIDLVSEGQALVLFPEGTRTRTGTIAHFKNGFGVIARRANATVVPVLVHGAFEAWPRTQRLPSLKPITVHFGCPFPPDQIGRNIGEKVHRVLTNLQKKVDSH